MEARPVAQHHGHSRAGFAEADLAGEPRLALPEKRVVDERHQWVGTVEGVRVGRQRAVVLRPGDPHRLCRVALLLGLRRPRGGEQDRCKDKTGENARADHRSSVAAV